MDNIVQHPKETPIMKLFEITSLTLLFVFNSLILDPEWLSIAIAVGGSLSGAMILAYFRRDNTLWELFLKVFSSAIGGLVLGTVIQEYLHVEPPAYRLGLFFFSSLLALGTIGAMLSIADRNLAQVLRAVIQRLSGLKMNTEVIKQEVRVNKSKIAKLEHDQEEKNK